MVIFVRRYEFGNKGGDIFIEALARLNHYLQVKELVWLAHSQKPLALDFTVPERK